VAPDRGPESLDALVADLRALGATSAGGGRVSGAEVAAVVSGVTARLQAAAPAPALPAARVWAGLSAALARRRRRIAVAIVVVLLALTGVPAVRAAVAEWFGFAGVQVRLGPAPEGSPTPSAAPPPAPVPSRVTLAQARSLVAFEVLVPSLLGPPDGVEVSPDRRVVSMSWTDPAAGVVRLDQFDGELDYAFAKQAEDVAFTTVAGDFAMWFERPHEVVWLAGGATLQRQPPRLAGHTLIWQHGGTALRLEGNLPLERAREIGGSTQPAAGRVR
jgi:hypothetical protein